MPGRKLTTSKGLREKDNGVPENRHVKFSQFGRREKGGRKTPEPFMVVQGGGGEGCFGTRLGRREWGLNQMTPAIVWAFRMGGKRGRTTGIRKKTASKGMENNGREI